MAWQDDMVSRLKQAVNGEKDLVMDEYMALTGKSRQTLYRIAKRHGYAPGRKVRADAGRSVLTEQQIDCIFALIHVSGRERKGPIMPVEKALIIAEDNGIIERGLITASRLQTLLRERKMSKTCQLATDPHIPMRSLYPNHVHQVDASICIQYYLRPGSPLQILPRELFYKNKFENYAKIKRKIIRWVLTDHYSGAIYVKYYQSAGERAEDLFDFLASAWEPKHEKFPVRGVPEILMMDPGAANKSKPVVALLRHLDVDVPAGLPGTPTRDGSVEKAQDLVERWFESGLKFNPASSIEELNECALDWCVWYNATKKHTRHGQARTTMWLRIPSDKLREMPDRDLLRHLFAHPSEERTVSSRYSISYRPGNARYEKQEYSLRHIENLMPGAKVSVVMRPFSWPEISVIYDGQEYAAGPIEKDAAGFATDAAIIGQEFKSLPETPVQRAAKRADNLAYGDEKKKGAIPFSDLQVMGNLSERVAHDFMPRKGVPHALTSADLPQKDIPVTTLFKRLIAEHGQISLGLNTAIRSTYGASIPEGEADRIAAEIAATGTFTPPKIAAAGGAAC